MRILMISPQPFFEPRGAPFCVFQHIKALTELGYEVDLVTYPIGKSVELSGLNIYRTPRLPFVRSVKAGPSFAKIPLDMLLFFTAFYQLSKRKYSQIHAHEEASLLGILLRTFFGGKLLYYMHCNLAELIADSGFIKSPFLNRIVAAVQQFMVRKADAIIAFYPFVAETAQNLAPSKPIYTILPPAVDEDLPMASTQEIAQLKQSLNLSPANQVLLYTGTLESYQGLDILLQSITAVRVKFPSVRCIIVGGKPEQVTNLRQMAKDLNVADCVHVVGQRPLEEMPSYMALADILLSPRSKGTHTPLKLYTYLRSGKPMVATSILSHTQVLTSAIALLVSPTPEDLADGIIELLEQPQQAQELGLHGQQFAEEHFSWPVFLEKNRQVYEEFTSGVRDEASDLSLASL